MKTKIWIRNRFVLAGDVILIIVSAFISYALRLELDPHFTKYLPSLFYLAGVSLIVKPAVYYFFGLYKRIWVYASIKELKIITTAVASASILVAAIMLILFMSARLFLNFPRSVLIIDFLLSIIMVGGLRFVLRLVFESRVRKNDTASSNKRAIIIGAGDAGALVVKEMQRSTLLNLKPIGFLDDDPHKLHQQISDVPVIGVIDDLEKFIDNHKIEEVVISIPSAPGSIVRKVTNVCQKFGIPSRTMPGLFELLGGKVSINRLREVDIEDLLRRQPTRIDNDQIPETITGKRILVTGAGGSIGRELCRQISRLQPSELLLLGHGENSIYESLLDLHETFPEIHYLPLIVDIRNPILLRTLFQLHKPEVVFHTAAHKHVPLMEFNVQEAVTNNVIGTRTLVDACLEEGVKKFVFISSDKAILPANVMGATKRIAEMIVLDAGQNSENNYCIVRFGNVLGSRGSVVPLFKRQIANGGPVTITHPDMERFFMTIPEAVHLVLQAASLGKGGDAFILNMGEPVKILDLAHDLIRLSGLEPGVDIKIEFTGIRPGEKLNETIWDENLKYSKTRHPDIFQIREMNNLDSKELANVIRKLKDTAESSDISKIIQMLNQSIPGAHLSHATPSDFIIVDS